MKLSEKANPCYPKLAQRHVGGLLIPPAILSVSAELLGCFITAGLWLARAAVGPGQYTFTLHQLS